MVSQPHQRNRRQDQRDLEPTLAATATATTIADQTWAGHWRTVNVVRVETQIDCQCQPGDERFPGSHNSSWANYVLAGVRQEWQGAAQLKTWIHIQFPQLEKLGEAREPRGSQRSGQSPSNLFGRANEVIWRRGRRFNVICLWLALWPNKLSVNRAVPLSRLVAYPGSV